MSNFGFPANLASRAAKIQRWLDFVASGDRPNPATDAEFLHEIFVDVLGYRSLFYPDRLGWELEFSPTPCLGFFTEEKSHVLAEIFPGEINLKPVPIHDTTEWAIVTNYEEIRLYHRFSSPLFYQQFYLNTLTNPDRLKQFYFILCRRTLLTASPKTQEPSRTLQLLEESHQIEADIAKDFYSHYHKIRLQLIKDFQYRLQQLPQAQASNPIANEIKNLAIAKAQKLLSRILFIAVGEDRQLLANGLLNNAYEFYNPYTSQPVWVNYKAIFNWIDRGNSKPNWQVNAYGSSLFAQDDLLDRFLFVGDELCRQIKELTRFNFDEEISNAIIAFVLEESIKDLSLLKTESDKLPKRRKYHYPPRSLLNSISVVSDIRAYLANKAPLNPSDRSSSDAEIVEYLQKRLSCLIDLKIVNANCNSGIALVTALDCLLEEYQNLEQELLKLDIAPNFPLHEEFPGFDEKELIATICQRNLFGCDPDPENIAIAKLCLWLRTAQCDRPLIPLDLNIKQGDLSSRNLAAKFTEIFAQPANPDCLLLIYTKT
ncbi:hypothetical protein [Pseudanabaena sp. PCC 6802]|uniref:hypothetical protein n=1 Tax=Pseudanabaena sp. PCC 6802 TaxID=118173 RepID=UPI00034D3F11|nr:hypothetical protein [Pseudanabaena sp. PCC 6802]